MLALQKPSLSLVKPEQNNPILPTPVVAASGASIVLVGAAGLLYYRKRRQHKFIEAKTLVKKI